jgi:hypothetical protein
MDEALSHTFRDAYRRYELAFAQFTTSNNAGAAEADQQARYREFADAQHAFLQAAHRLARSLLEQTQGQAALTQATPPELEGAPSLERTDPPEEPLDALVQDPPDPELITLEPGSEMSGSNKQDASEKPVRAGFLRFKRPH